MNRLLIHYLCSLLCFWSSVAWGDTIAEVSAKSLGAMGDGQADDTAALQRALDAGQGKVHLPAGTYKLTGPLRLGSGNTLTGPGTLLQTTESVTLTNRIDETSPTGIRIIGIRIHKQFRMDSQVEGILLSGVNDLRIEGIELTGIASVSGIQLEHCRNFIIRDCDIHDFQHDERVNPRPSGKRIDGIGITPLHCQDGQIVNNRIFDLTVTEASADALSYQTDAINPRHCRNLVIANNVIRNVGEGIDLIQSVNCTLTGNVMEDCWHFGIKIIHGSHLNTITNNVIRNPALAGIEIDAGNPKFGELYGNVIQGNLISNPGGITRPNDQTPYRNWKTWNYCGIDIVNNSRAGSSARDNLISGNLIYDDQTSPTAKYGIIERFIRYDEHDKPVFVPEPFDKGGTFTNQIQGNMIRNMRVAAYQTGSPVRD